MDNYVIKLAISDVKDVPDCEFLSRDFKGSIAVLVEAAESCQDTDSQNENVEMMNEALRELRAEVEEARGQLSNLDDTFSNIYDKIDDADCAVSEMESEL
jgi:peptidoglycan hydrolase CwlO-like protein